MLDETKAHFLQDVYYISNQNPKILSLLREEVEEITDILFHIQAKKTGWHQDFTENSVDASARFIEMYIKYPDWYCKSFRNRLYLEVFYNLYERKKKNRDKLIKEEDLDENITNQEKEYGEDTLFVLEDIKDSQPENYSKILFECYRARTYKSFILKLQPVVGKRWIYDYAKRLHLLYKYTRKETNK